MEASQIRAPSAGSAATMVAVNPESLRALVAAFEARTLPKLAWTHEAHLAVCWDADRRFGPERAVDVMRTLIRAYNDATGQPNSDTEGYHETLTRYFVAAVHAAGAADPDALVELPSCRREAPLRHWSRQRLFSVQARRGWVEPDLAPLPWITRAVRPRG